MIPKALRDNFKYNFNEYNKMPQSEIVDKIL